LQQRALEAFDAGRGHEIEAVLEARAAAALDADPEHVVVWVIGDDLGDALGRALGER